MQSAVRVETPAQGVSELDDRQHVIQRRAVLIITVLPFVGFLFAILNYWGGGFSWTIAGIAVGFYLFTGLGVTAGYHRLFTHQSFEASRPVKILLAVGGSMAIQGSLIDWVATHRRHHAYSDQEGDPHSPHLDEGTGLTGVIRGLWHAHIGWLATPERTHIERWAPDMLKDRDLVWIHRKFPLFIVLSFALPALLGLALTGTIEGAVIAFLWGSLARIFLLHHVTWSINSICHFYGKRPFRSSDFSTNNWVLSLISFGESWHNNHHAFPTSAVHGIGRGQIDPTGGLIRLLEKMRLVRNVRVVTPKQLKAKVISKFTPRPTLVQGRKLTSVDS